MNTQYFALAVIAAGALALPGCKANLGSDQTNVAADFEDNQYEENIVTGRNRRDYEDQGQGVSPKVITAIDHTIKNVYERDFERCLEEEMGRQETRFLRAIYTVEFSINTEGLVTEGKILELSASKQNAKGATLGTIDEAELRTCIKTSVEEWEFDDKPEVDFKHTYRGQVGEAY
jgi:hypothetical protein